MTVWDIGGQDKVRQLWHHYYENCDGLVYLIDSADLARVDESIEEMQKILLNDNIKGNIPILILANKQDIPNAISPNQLIQKVSKSLNNHPWFIQGCILLMKLGFIKEWIG